MAKRLEDFAQDEDQDDDEDAVNRRQRNKITGLDIMNEFKASFKSIYKKFEAAVKQGEMTDEEVKLGFREESQKLFADLTEKSKDNPYLKHLIQQSKLT